MASRALKPAYQARNAAKAAVPGNSDAAAWDWALFTIASLAARHSHCDKKDYLDSMNAKTGVCGTSARRRRSKL